MSGMSAVSSRTADQAARAVVTAALVGIVMLCAVSGIMAVALGFPLPTTAEGWWGLIEVTANDIGLYYASWFDAAARLEWRDLAGGLARMGIYSLITGAAILIPAMSVLAGAAVAGAFDRGHRPGEAHEE